MASLFRVTEGLTPGSRISLLLEGHETRLAALEGVSYDWDMPVVLNGYRRMTYDGGATAELAVPLASAEQHADGGIAVLIIPAGSCTTSSALRLAAELGVDGDAFDEALDYVIVVERVGTRCIGSARSLAARDTTAPALVSATVRYSDADALELVFDEACYIDDVIGLTLAFSVGTARTVTAVESGNGTDTITLTLSGSVSASDAFALDVAATTVQDMAGNWLAAVDDFACGNSVGDPDFADTWVFLRGDNLGADGSSITTWTDQSGEGNHFTQSTAGERPTVLVDAAINSQKAVDFDGTDDSLYNVTGIVVGGSPATDVASFTVLVVWKHDGTTSDIPASFVDSGGVEFSHADLARDAGTLGFYGGNNVNYAGGADSSTSWRYAWGLHRGASRDLYVDGALLGSSAVAVNPNAVKYGRIGRGYQTGAYPLDGKIAELRFIGRELTSQELADWETYVATRYGL